MSNKTGDTIYPKEYSILEASQRKLNPVLPRTGNQQIQIRILQIKTLAQMEVG